MEIRIFDTPEEAGKAAADIIVETVVANPAAVLGLATGATPLPVYREMIRRYEKGDVTFSKTVTFNLDEYSSLPRKAESSYYTFMWSNLFSRIDIDGDNVHILDGCAPDKAAECARFDGMIEEAGGVDVQLLGIGTNGHIGFNEPADEFTGGTFEVKLSQSTRDSNIKYFADGNMPEYALTIGIGTIMKAKKILLMATGESKAKAIYAAVKGEVTPRCPASVLQNHPDAVFLLDKAAAKLLED